MIGLYIAGAIVSQIVIRSILHYREGNGTYSYSDELNVWGEWDSPIPFIGMVFWPIVLVVSLLSLAFTAGSLLGSRSSNGYFYRLGRRHKERDELKRYQELEKSLLLKKYEAEIDQMLQERR